MKHPPMWELLDRWLHPALHLDSASNTNPDRVICGCGAIYQRTVSDVLHVDRGKFSCTCCGQMLERWESPRIPYFKLIRRPAGE